MVSHRAYGVVEEKRKMASASLAKWRRLSKSAAKATIIMKINAMKEISGQRIGMVA
jgi:hypothetical protein